MSLWERLKPKRNKIETDPWPKIESQGIYLYPIPALENSLEIGRRIAALDPPEKEVEQIGQFLVSHSPESHKEAYTQALDFLVPDGTPVLASADGVIVEIVIGNKAWGSTQEFARFMNYITVQHSNGEFSQYCHLAPGSLTEGLAVGVEVKKGTQLALTGKTGWTDRDHLHFLVGRIEKTRPITNPHGFRSLKPKFEISVER